MFVGQVVAVYMLEVQLFYTAAVIVARMDVFKNILL